MGIFDKNKIVIASRKTTLKLIDQTLKIAKEVNLSPDLKKSFNEEIDSIQQNTEKLELVLSVVGIMKAGKSTLINSIIGKELLPSRNTAMTVIPTYIKHDKSITGVKYYFKHAKEFGGLLNKLKQDGYSTNHETSLIAQRLANDNYVFNDSLDSLQQIHEELEVINDICRYCFYQTKYRDMINTMFQNSDDFPTLFTEFKILENVENGCDVSSFVVVDTPGANEAKLPILKSIVDKQIERSSALLLVLNYTDLASEADEAMRERIKQEASAYKDRLIVAVNRFDAKDHRSMTMSETKRYIREELLGDIALADGFIFPVSARNALLSRQALDYLARHQKFELASLLGWQRDFLDINSGGNWDEESPFDREAIDNPKKTWYLAKKLFDTSQIGLFIDTAITRAYQNAGPDTLIASLTKLKGLIEKRLICCLETDINSSRKTVEELKNRVSRVEAGLTDLKELMYSTEKKLESWQEDQIQDTEKHIKSCLEKIDFDELELKSIDTKNDLIIFKDFLSFFTSSPKSTQKEKNNEEDFKGKLLNIVKIIQRAIDKALHESTKILAKDLQSDVEKFSSFIKEDLLEDINLSEKSIDITIHFNHDAIDKNDHLDIKHETRQRARKVFGFDISWFPIESIAYETYTETTKTFNKESYVKALIEQLKAIQQDNLTLITEKLREVADEFQSEISQLCDIIQYSATSTIERKEQATEEQKTIESFLNSQIVSLVSLADYCKEITRGLEKEKEA